MPLSAHHAYLLGFTPQVAGLFWSGLAVLETAGVGGNTEWSQARAPEIARQTRLVEELLRLAGGEPKPMPRSMAAFQSWAEDVREQTYQMAKKAYDEEDELAAKTLRFRVRLAHDLGEQMGDLVHLYLLASLVQTLRVKSPWHPVLDGHAATLARARDQAIERVGRVAGYAGGFDDVAAEAERIAGLVREGPRADIATADELAAMVAALELARVEALFTSPPSSPG